MSLLSLLGAGFHQNDVLITEVIGEIVEPMPTSITGCIQPTRERTVSLEAQTVTAFRWHFYDGNGQAVLPAIEEELMDNTLDQTNVPGRCALFWDLFQINCGVHVGKIVFNEGEGLTILPPASVRNSPSIYAFEIYWLQPEVNGGRTQLKGRGFISVEESALRQLSNPDGIYRGPISISEIRDMVRDYPQDNDLTGGYQFSDTEIIRCLLAPLKFFNETPPHIVRYSAANFPYRDRWLKATVARLQEIHGLWMRGNQVPIQAEGVGGDDRANWRDILDRAKQEWTEYEVFVHYVKRIGNIPLGFRGF